MSDQPIFTPEEARTRETFLALMWALSYPGRLHTLPDGEMSAFARIAEALLDLETSYFTPDAVIAHELARTGARHLEAQHAAYHFYPSLDNPEVLQTIETASPGTMLYPDTAATLVIGCQLGQGSRFQLTGPGINGSASAAVDGIPAAFWRLRARVNRYPLGWDIFLINMQAGPHHILGLPRTTQITEE